MKKLLLILSLICTTVAFSQTSTKNTVSKTKFSAVNVTVKINCHTVISEYSPYCHCSSCTNYNVTYTVVGEGIVLTGMTTTGSCPVETTGSCGASSGTTVYINESNMPSGE